MLALLGSVSAIATVPAHAQTGLEAGDAIDVEFPGNGFDLAIDDDRNVAYVSIPTANQIAVVSLASFDTVGHITLNAGPNGIDISSDGAALYAALDSAGSIVRVDLATLQVTDTVNIATELDNARTWDVAEGMPGEVYVSASPGSGGFARIVRVDFNNGNAASVVASNRIIRATPALRTSPDRQFLYIGEGFSPNSLYKLDITQPTAPIVLEDDHGSVGGTSHIALSSSGNRIYLRSGQVLDAGSFNAVGSIDGGASWVSRSGNFVFVVPTAFGVGPDRIEVFSTSSLQHEETITMPCAATNVTTVRALEADRGVIALVDNRLCGRALASDLVCSLPGTDDELLMVSQGTTLNCKEVDVMDLVTIELRSPDLSFVGDVPALLFQLHNGSTLPTPVAAGGLQIDPTRPTSFGTLFRGPFGPLLMPQQGVAFSLSVPPGLAPMTLRVQGLVLSPAAANGVFATSAAHDISLVTGPTPVITRVIPEAAPPNAPVTILGEAFEPGVEVWVDGTAVVPVAQTATTLAITTPNNMSCNTTIRVRNPGGRRDSVPFNPALRVTDVINETGPTSGGTPVVLLGSGFVEGTTATVGGAVVSILARTYESVVLLTPPGMGEVSIELTSPNGCTVTRPFTYL